jgi:UDP-N-acetylmuramoyl-L-alanyl-D-glutamate--2,6-diaminopimelate ligase
MTTTTTFKVGAKIVVNATNLTTISPFALQKMLADMVKSGCEFAVVETTSHAIEQYRNWGIRYLAVAMTNVTHDHLDYHKTFDNYLEAKLRLFRSKPRVAVVNADDPNADKFLKFTAGRRLTYSSAKRADVTARKILPAPDGTIFTLVTPTVQTTIDLKIPALFNVSNALCASAICYGLNIPIDVIKKGLEAVTNVPGRLEKIEKGQDFTVIIDYAHTPDALEKLYSSLKPGVKGKMLCVLGSCGDRDRTKRPIMGALAGHYGDIVVVTDEEPYTEDPCEIIKQVAEGVRRGDKVKKVEGEDFFVVENRRDGIQKALSVANKGDLVIITGMGAQEFRVVGDHKEPWSERKVVAEELGKLGYNKEK